jgi:hypothetical protein
MRRRIMVVKFATTYETVHPHHISDNDYDFKDIALTTHNTPEGAIRWHNSLWGIINKPNINIIGEDCKCFVVSWEEKDVV